MKRPRIIVIDRNAAIRELLTCYLSARKYEVFSFHSATFCSLYNNPSQFCNKDRCADIVVIENEVADIKFLQRQSDHGCRIDERNKAVISSGLADDMKVFLEKTGSAFFEKPIRLGQISIWLDDCKKRMQQSPLRRWDSIF